MRKHELIKTILEEADIWHNASTLSLPLPDAPEGMPDDVVSDIFWHACEMLVTMFCDEWQHESINDSGNRNLCDCRTKKPHRVVKKDGMSKCLEHDVWHVYQTGRSGATLYWTKYWAELNSRGVYFKYTEDELNEMLVPELKEMHREMVHFSNSISNQKVLLPDELAYQYRIWKEDKEDEERKQALGYFKTLEELLESDNEQIVRLAKGIKKELNK